MSELRIQAAIRHRLALNGVATDAIPNAARRTPWEARRAKAEGMTAGAADLLLRGWEGRMALMEVKTDTGRLSPAQREYRDDCARRGIPYAVVRSSDDAIAALAAWGWPINESAPDAARTRAGGCANRKGDLTSDG